MSRIGGWIIILAFNGMACLAVGTTSSAAAPPSVSLRAALHVHSTMSTGSLSLESLARRAEQQQLDVLILTENFSLRYDYGFYPFEGVLKYQVAFPSIMEYGIQRFLDEVRAVQQRHQHLIIIPGIEVAPHYYWTGSLLSGNLTMHNAQRNLLVIGLEKAEDYEGLPARGNVHSYVWDRRSVVNGLPLLLLASALWLWISHEPTVSEWTGSRRPYRRMVAGSMMLLCVGLLVNAWPMKTSAFSSYDDRTGYRPYQALIDAARERGGLVFWSMTEARDFSRHSFGPLGTITIQTDPHPEALVLTRGYTGFGGLYQDTRKVVTPGGLWDQLLRSRSANSQEPIPTMVGEVAFHGTADAGKDLDRVYTVMQVSERTATAVMTALRAGHAYAVARGDHNILLQLDEFHVSQEGASAGIGETLERQGDGDLLVRVGISTVDGQPHPVKLRLIRSGRVIEQMEGRTPVQLERVDREAGPDEWLQYRVEVLGTSGELLTNPIYVAPTKSQNANNRVRMGGRAGHADLAAVATS